MAPARRFQERRPGGAPLLACFLICTFPFPARETLTWRSRRNQGLRIALGHSLERN